MYSKACVTTLIRSYAVERALGVASIRKTVGHAELEQLQDQIQIAGSICSRYRIEFTL